MPYWGCRLASLVALPPLRSAPGCLRAECKACVAELLDAAAPEEENRSMRETGSEMVEPAHDARDTIWLYAHPDETWSHMDDMWALNYRAARWQA